MEKIPTAKEIINKWQKEVLISMGTSDANPNSLEDAMIEFAKLHVEEALKFASKNAEAHIDHNGEWVSSNVKSRVNKDSILNSYPLENIK